MDNHGKQEVIQIMTSVQRKKRSKRPNQRKSKFNISTDCLQKVKWNKWRKTLLIGSSLSGSKRWFSGKETKKNTKTFTTKQHNMPNYLLRHKKTLHHY